MFHPYDEFFADVLEEIDRALAKHGPQDHLPDSTDNPTARETWETIARNSCDRAFREGRLTHSHILDEECAEALTAAARGDTNELRKELVQVAAVCAQWIEALDARATAEALTAEALTAEALTAEAQKPSADETPDCLKTLSPEERASFEGLTEEQIQNALWLGAQNAEHANMYLRLLQTGRYR